MDPDDKVQTAETPNCGRGMAIDSDERPWLVYEQMATVGKLQSDVYCQPGIVAPGTCGTLEVKGVNSSNETGERGT